MTFVKGYFRDGQHRPAYIRTTEALLPYDLGELLAAELADVLPKYVERDRLEGWPEDFRQRMQEVG